MKYYSEELNELFDSEETLIKKETEYKQKKEEAETKINDVKKRYSELDSEITTVKQTLSNLILEKTKLETELKRLSHSDASQRYYSFNIIDFILDSLK